VGECYLHTVEVTSSNLVSPTSQGTPGNGRECPVITVETQLQLYRRATRNRGPFLLWEGCKPRRPSPGPAGGPLAYWLWQILIATPLSPYLLTSASSTFPLRGEKLTCPALQMCLLDRTVSCPPSAGDRTYSATTKAYPSNDRKRAEAPHGHTGPLSPSGESGSVPPVHRRDRDERGATCCGVSIMLEPSQRERHYET
jgi:hypothetical protein